MKFQEMVRMGLEEYYDELKRAVDSLTYAERRFMPGPNSHHVDFAVWHIARVEDAWINRFAKQATDQVWSRGNWAERLNLPVREIPGFGPESGWGWDGDQVKAMPASEMDDLWAYLDAVRADTLQYLDSITEDDLDRCPDAKQAEYSIGRMWSHLLVEESQHVGQVAYLRGLQRGLNS